MMTQDSLIDAFTAQVVLTPDALAVEDGDMLLSYAALRAQVDACAAGLASYGVQPGDHVAILLPRTWQLVVTTLAILRCRAVVVPLDDQSPDSRLRTMLQTADCKLVIANPGVRFAAHPVAAFDDLFGACPLTVTDVPSATPISCDDPAFMFFTSGSTGTPKAVLVPHRAVLRLGQAGYTPLEPGRRFGSLSNPSFDAINFDIWAPLLTGGVCVIIAPATSTDFHHIAKVLTTSRVDTLFLTVALFNAIVAAVPTCFATLGTVLIGGERINTRTVLKWYEDNPKSDCVIHNVYGPTECATFSLCYPIARSETRADAPIGLPLPGTDIHIDADTSELWIGGAAVGLCYYKQPDITDAAFVRHSGGIYYRTGDIVTLNDDDTVHFVGRIGRQSKIRGFRVEPGEVETLLESHPDVSQAFVHVHTTDDAPAQLHGYLILNTSQDSAPDYVTFARFLQQALPAYMIPHLLFLVPSFPMTANGKINVAALTDQQMSPWKPAATDTAPDPTLDLLLDLANDILERSDLTGTDSFLTGGGDSLRALTFKHRLEREQGLVLALPDIVSRSFGKLVARVKRRVPGEGMGTEPVLRSFADHKMAPATSEQKRLWLDAQQRPHSRAYSVPLVYDVTGPVDAERLGKAVAETFAAHPVFATAFVDRESALWQVKRPKTGCRFHAFPTGQITAETCAATTQKIFEQPFDLGSAALCQVYWMPFDDTNGRLVIHAHHIVLDGWALNLFLQEISGRYDVAGTEPDAGTLDMAGFAEWQSRAADQPEQAAQRHRLGQLWNQTSLPQAPLVPLHDAEPAVARVISTQLSATQLAPLYLLAQARGVTPFQVWAMICAWAFSAVTGQTRFNLASPTNNRHLPASSKTIGMFANTVILPCRLEPDKSSNATLDAHEQVWSEIMGCADIPLEHLHDRSGIDDGRQRLHFDCMFVMENTDYDSLRLQHAVARFSHLPQVAPKAPLVVFVTPTEHGATLHAEIDQGYFTDQDAARFLEMYVKGLVLIGTPDQAIGQMIAPASTALSGPVRPLQSDTITSLLRAQAARTPGAIALQSGNVTLSYGALMARANGLSHWLASQMSGQGPAVVALYMDPGADHVTALVALAQINATILPLDPSLPLTVLENIVTLGQPALILGDAHAADFQISGTPVVPLPRPDAPATFAPRFEGNPLYLLFTSGSTGTPKGVRVWDDTLCNLLQWQRQFGGLDFAARTQQFSKLSFDVSFQEILTTLTSGGTLTLLPSDLRHDARAILERMRDTGCERIFLPFVALKLLAETALAERIALPDLKQVISAGEQLLCTQTLRDWFKTMPNARLINHYGPTETHVISSHHLPENPDDWPDVAPIGQPISNCGFSIDSLNDELRVSGPFIRKCYLDPAQNAARFASGGDDENDRPHYLTGDRVNLLRNDRLACLGRLDDQIKISGHRIERQEIETVLNRHANVALSMVDLSPDGQLVAMVEAAGPLPTTAQLNLHLAQSLPAYVRLAQVVQVTGWPRTASGKINRKALKVPDRSSDEDSATDPANHPATRLCLLFKVTLGRDITPTQTFWDAGANSLDLMRYRNAVQRELSCQISVADLFGAGTTPARLAELLGATDRPAVADPHRLAAQNKPTEIAIIGLAVDLPGAGDIGQFVQMITQNRSGIEMFPASPGTIGARSQMDAPLGFDPAYFGISPQEAILMDPQQRHLLMNAVQVLADAGIDPGRSPRTIGVVASCGENTYYQDMLRHADPARLPDAFQMALHHDKDFAATKLAYRLGLGGPAMTVQAACGSSLIGVHTAAGMLRNGDCDVMLVGASLVDPSLRDGYTYRPQHIFSDDGTCRPFDQSASGTVGASGVCFMALAPLSVALADGHHIYGTLDGSSVNNDGRDKMSYTAPSATGQQAALSRALQASGLHGSDIGYVEAHGTGTPLGDPIEIDAIDQVYGERDDALIVSSLKSQIGHLGAAAGLAGMIRATLAINHRIFPPNLHFDTPNPELNLHRRKIAVPATSQPWFATHRRAGISSFGIGGTNAHAIIGQYDGDAALPVTAAPTVLMISAHQLDSLRVWASQIADYLEDNPDRAASVVRFLRFGAPERACRAAFVWQDVPHAARALRDITSHTTTAMPAVDAPSDHTDQDSCTAWLAGATQNTNGQAAPAPFGFPVYPFQRDTYDFPRKPDTPVAVSPPSPNLGRLAAEAWLSQPAWVPLGAPAPCRADSSGLAVVLCGSADALPSLEGYDRVITVTLAKTRATSGPDRFQTTLDPRDFSDLGRQVAAQGLPDKVDLINTLPLAIRAGFDAAAIEHAQLACLDVMPGLVALARELEVESLRLINLSEGGAPVATGTIVHPLTNMLCGASTVLPGETGLSTYWLDFQTGCLDHLSTCLHASSLPQGRCAFAHGQIWQRSSAPAPAPGPAAGSLNTRPHSKPRRALVIGGTGGIGRNICAALLAEGTEQVDIIARNPNLPESLSADADRITLHPVDLCARRVDWPRFDSPVDTIIFAAGVGSYNPVASRDAAEMRRRNQVKLAAVAHLETLVTQLQPARVIYCSSMASELGGKGQLDYSATNGVLDGMAHWTNPQAPGTRRLSLNWDIWSQSGMAVAALSHDAQHREHLAYGLSDAEGRATFLRALEHGCPQLLISTLPLAEAQRRFYTPVPNQAPDPQATSTLGQIVSLASDRLGLDPDVIDASQRLEELGLDSILMIDLLETLQDSFGHAPELSVIPPDCTLTDLAALVMPVTEDDRPVARICALFAETLGLRKVAAQESLSELCVDSLHALELIEKIQTAFGVTLAVSDFGPDQTPAMICAHLSSSLPTAAAQPQVMIDQWRAGTSDRVICFVHPVGGETACYKPLLDKIDPAASIYAIADPKLRAIDPVSQTVTEQASGYLAALTAQLDCAMGQIDLFGWSFGGWLAQEMAVQAETAGTPFRHIAMIDPPDPESGPRIGRINRADIQDAFLFELAPRLSSDVESSQPLATQIAPELQNQLDRLVTCCALNMEAMKTHRPNALGCTPTSVFVAETAAKGLLVETVDACDQMDRWRGILSTVRHCQSLSADHYTILHAPALTHIAKLLFDQDPVHVI